MAKTKIRDDIGIEEKKRIIQSLSSNINSANWDVVFSIFNDNIEIFSGDDILDIFGYLLYYDSSYSMMKYFFEDQTIKTIYQFKGKTLSNEELIEILIDEVRVYNNDYYRNYRRLSEEGVARIAKKSNYEFITFSDDKFVNDVSNRINLKMHRSGGYNKEELLLNIKEIIGLINFKFGKNRLSREEIITMLTDPSAQGFYKKPVVTLEMFQNIYLISRDILRKDQKFKLMVLASKSNRLEIAQYIYNQNRDLLDIKYNDEIINILNENEVINLLIKKYLFNQVNKLTDPKRKEEFFFSVVKKIDDIEFLIQEEPYFLYKKNNCEKLLKNLLQQHISILKKLMGNPELGLEMSGFLINIMYSHKITLKSIQHLFNSHPMLNSGYIFYKFDSGIIKPRIAEFHNIIELEPKYFDELIVNRIFTNDRAGNEPLQHALNSLISRITRMEGQEDIDEIKLGLCNAKSLIVALQRDSKLIVTKDYERDENEILNAISTYKLDEFIEGRGKENSEYEILRQSLIDNHAKLIRETAEDVIAFMIKDVVQMITLINRSFGLKKGMIIIIANIAGHIAAEEFKPKLSEYLSPEKLKNIIEEICAKIYERQIETNLSAISNIEAKNQNLIVETVTNLESLSISRNNKIEEKDQKSR